MGQINKERERYVYVNMWGRGGGVEGQGFGEGVEDKGLGDGRGEVVGGGDDEEDEAVGGGGDKLCEG